jgi:hypothetical protein
MSNTSNSVPVHPVVGALDAVDDTLAGTAELPVWGLSDDEVEAALDRWETTRARHASLGLRLIAEVDGRDLGRRVGATCTAAWLRHRYRIRPADAKWLVNTANRIGCADTGAGPTDYGVNTGDISGGGMPATGAALAAGEVSVDHAVVVAKTMDNLPATLEPAQRVAAEAELAGMARQFDPATLQRLGGCLVDVLAPDTLDEDEDDAVAKRELYLSDMTGRVRGRFDPEALAMIQAMLDPLTTPQTGEDGAKDTRSAGRRTADALVEIARRVLNHGQLVPTGHGAAAHLTIITELDDNEDVDNTDDGEPGATGSGAWDTSGEPPTSHTANDGCGDTSATTDDAGDSTVDTDVNHNADGDGDTSATSGGGDATDVGAQPGGQPNGEHDGRDDNNDPAGRVIGRLGRGELSWGGALSAAAVQRNACDAGIRWIITNTHGVPLHVGREHRTATPGQWAALTARDGGCVFPGCTRPVEWTEAHHVVWWRNNGGTNIDNLCLLCSAHHRAVHHHGWDIQFDSDSLPEFLPPAWIDPNRTPRRNNRPRYHKNNTPGP